MVVFTFVNNGHAGGYVISSGRAALGWRGLPYDLDHEMEDIKRKGEEVEEVSIGLDGDWFLRTNTRHACKTEHGRADVVSNVEQFVHLLQQAGLSLADYAIQFFTFVPDTTGYVTVLHKTDGSLTRCAWHNVPRELDMVLEREGQKGVRRVTVGVNGAFVVTLNSGAVLWGASIPGGLQQLLEDAVRRRRSVAAVSLSLASPTWYFVQFADGATNFSLPPDWHQSVNHYSAQAVQTSRTAPKMATSYHHDPSARSQTYPQYRPQPPLAQFGSYSPQAGGSVPQYPQYSGVPQHGGVSPHGGIPQQGGFPQYGAVPQYGGGPNPGYKPFESNPHVSSAFTGAPQQPAPQQPVYNVTNIYNTAAQQPQQQPQQQEQQQQSGLAKYNGMFTLLGGALKLAGTVLGPTLQHDWSSFTGN